jgi:hypothetical protein
MTLVMFPSVVVRLHLSRHRVIRDLGAYPAQAKLLAWVGEPRPVKRANPG